MKKTPEGAVVWFTFGVTPKSAVGETREDLGKRQSNLSRTDISIHSKTFQWRWRHFGATNEAYKAPHASCPVSRTPVALLQSAKASHVVYKQQSLVCFILFPAFAALSLNSAEVSTISNDAKK
jgi:hypothetical protein